MRITLETTESNAEHSKHITITVPNDDLHPDDLFEDLIKPVLLAYGYDAENVEDVEVDKENWLDREGEDA